MFSSHVNRSSACRTYTGTRPPIHDPSSARCAGEGHTLTPVISTSSTSVRGAAKTSSSAARAAAGALAGALAWYRGLRGRDLASVGPVDVPTTYLWSDLDVAVARGTAARCAEHVTGDYRFVELAGISHWIPEQAPEQLAVAILDRIAST